MRPHGSYLQGMETEPIWVPTCNKHNARILPTRNGNSHGRWLQYLLPPEARILPTRNGNTLDLVKLPTVACRARILPTRNGNALLGIAWGGFYLGTDPTYKEWKPRLRARGRRRCVSTDPTYKEWKRLWPCWAAQQP